MSELRLLVPMNVEALVVGNDSRAEWVNLKPNFQGVYRLNQVLGQQLVQPFRLITGLHQPGIHLHWALPDGLTHGDTSGDGGRPKFPAIPNRWLVTRFCDQGGKQKLDLRSKAWIVESDTVTGDTKAAVWPTLSSEKLEKKEDYYVFVGMRYELSQWPKETKPPAPSVNITAVGYGDPAFPAYYPGSKGILGFHDNDLTDITNASLTYVVVGWYSDPARDPLQQFVMNNTVGDPFAKLEKFLARTKWTYPGFDAARAKTNEAKRLADELKESQEMIVRLQKVKNRIDQSAINELKKKIAALNNDIRDRSAEIADRQNHLPTQLLCHGVITGIQWKTAPDSGVPRDKPFEISIGETAVESLHTLFEKTLGGDLAELLSVFQYDLLAELEKPGGDSIVDHEVHKRSFRRLSRGIRWDLMQETRPPFGGTPEDGAAPVEDRAPPIPGDIRTLMEQLNTRQREINRLKRNQDSLTDELYATWYKKILNSQASADPTTEKSLNQRILDLQGEIKRVTTEIDASEDQGRPKGIAWDDLDAKLRSLLPGWKLQQFDEPEFWRPNDPVVLLAGEALQRSQRHGEDGRYRSDGRLLCRLSGQELSGIKIKIPFAKGQKDVEFGAANVDGWASPFATLGDRRVPPEVISLFRESLLLTLDAKRALSIVTAAYEKNEPGLSTGHVKEIKNESGELLDTYLKNVWDGARDPNVENPKLRQPATSKDEQTTWELVGIFPSPIVMNRWEKNPWLPVFLMWQVSWAPTYTDTLRVLDGWELTSQGTAFHRIGKNGAGQGRVTYSGTTLLSPGVTLQFSDRLRQYSLTHNNDKLRTVQTAVSSMNVLCQSLGGLTDQFLMRKSFLELQPLEPGSGRAGPQFSSIYESVKHVDWCSPLTDDNFKLFPVRSGYLKLERLWIVDAFGQLLKLEEQNAIEGLQPVLPSRLAGPDKSVQLEPRLSQPARVTIEWPPARLWDQSDETGSTIEQDFNPVCGWIVPNSLDKGLMIYDARGNALGALQAVQRKSWAQGAGAKRDEIESFHWVDIPGSKDFFFGTPLQSVTDPLGADANPHLRAFVEGLLSSSKRSGQAFSESLDKMNEAFSAGGSGSSHNPNLALLIGRPLALVRASLRLEIDGRVARSQRWDAIQSEQTGGIEKLKFPIRLGDCRPGASDDTLTSDDGLVGFFLKGKDNEWDYKQFYPAFGITGGSGDESDSDIKFSKYNFTPPLSIEEPLELTLLMDPARGLGVTSGILPRTIFRLPYGDITETLENKQVLFYTGPVVSPESEKEIRMPQPSDVYGQWSWTHHPDVKVWWEGPIAEVQKERGRFSETPLQIAEGWLKLITAPVAIRVFTIKGANPVAVEKTAKRDGEPAKPDRFVVAAGKTIILVWSVSGAEELELREEESTLFKSRCHPLPTQFAISVERNTTFTLVATGRAEQSSADQGPRNQTASRTITITLTDTS